VTLPLSCWSVNDDGLFSTSTSRRRPLLLLLLATLLAPLLLLPPCFLLLVAVAVKGERKRGLTRSWLVGVVLSSSPALLALMKLLLVALSFLSAEASDCARWLW